MKPEIEELIMDAVVDGIIDPMERKVIYEKAKELGVSQEEVDVVLNAKLYEMKNSFSIALKSFINKHAGAIIAVFAMIIGLVVSAFVFRAYFANIALFLITLTAGALFIRFLYRSTRSSKLCVFAGFVLFIVLLTMALYDYQKIEYDHKFSDRIRTIDRNIQTSNPALIMENLNALYTLKVGTNSMYNQYNSDEFGKFINQNDIIHYYWNRMLYIKGKINLAVLESHYHDFVAKFPKSKWLKEYTYFVNAQKYYKVSAEEKVLYQSIIQIQNYDQFAAKYSYFKRNYPNSRYINELDIKMEKLNVEKLKEIQGVKND